MKSIVPYLLFNGNCREAITFYHAAIGGDLHIMPFGDAPGCTPDQKDLVMHTKLSNGNCIIMASDGRPGTPVTAGDNFSVSIDHDSREEQTRIFNALATGGNVTMPLQDMFWGAHFGMLTDKFGIMWMFNCDNPK